MKETKKSFNPKTGEIKVTSKPHLIKPGWKDGKEFTKWTKGSDTPGTIKKDKNESR